MLLRGSIRSSNGVSKINVNEQLPIQRTTPTFIPHRHAFTAKLRSRSSQLSQIKAVSINPFNSTQAYLNLAEPQHQDFTADQKHSLKNSQNLAKFDNLQLQDFVRMAILGQNQGTQTKSKEIIKSLNGTWFKNTHSQELPTTKFYNSLGIKRNKAHYKLIKYDSQQYPSSREVLKKQYTPPNIFPSRKMSPRRIPIPKYLQNSFINASQIIESSSPLKDSIIRKTSQSKRPQKRSNTSFTNKPLNNLSTFEKNGFLLGKKIVMKHQ